MKQSSLHKKKVCFLMERRGLYDDRAYWKQAVGLINAGYQVYYLVISHTDPSDEGKTQEGIYYQIFKGKRYLPTVIGNYIIKKFTPVNTEFDQMFRAIEKIQPDVIQIVDLRILRILDRIRKSLPTTKIIYDIQEPRDHNLLDIRLKEWKIPFQLKRIYADYIQNWEYKQAQKCDYLLGVDDGIAKRIKLNLPEKPYQTQYNYTNLANQRAHVPIKNRIYDAAYVGGLSELRGAKVIVEAAKIVAKEIPSAQFLLLGKSFDPSLSEWIKDFILENNLTENITWIQGVQYQEVSQYYNQIKIGLNPLKNVPAHHEIIQIKLFEYMNYGIPIITSNFGEMQRYVEGCKVGEAIQPNKPKVLAETIINLLSNQEKLKVYSTNGYEAVDTKYNWERMEEKYLGIIQHLLSE